MEDPINNITDKPEPISPTAGALKTVLIVSLFLLTFLASMVCENILY